MKLFLLIGCAVWLSLATLCAQEVALPSKEGPSPAPGEPTPAPSPAPAATPQIIPTIPLIAPGLPEPAEALSAVPDAPSLSQLDEMFKQSPMGKAAEDYRLQVEWRQLKTRTTYDPEVLAAKAAAAAAATDLEKRRRLRAYYIIQYEKMRALASSPEMKNFLDAKQKYQLTRLTQPRVRPETAQDREPDR